MMSRFMSLVLALLVPCAMAQTPEADRQREYQREQDRQREEQQRRAQEEYQRQLRSTEDARKKTEEQSDDERRSANTRPATSSYDRPRRCRVAGPAQEVTRACRHCLTSGMCCSGAGASKVTASPRGRTNWDKRWPCWPTPAAPLCQFTFGDGITEFKSKTWASIDGYGDDSLGPIAYRADGKRLFALPAKGIEIMGFDVVSPNRIEVFNLPGCALVRVTGTTTATQSGPSNRAPPASGVGAPPPAAGAAKSSTAAASPSAPSTLSRLSPEVCRNTLLDKLGTVGVNQVRAMSDVRFNEPAIEGKVPNTNNLRIDLRGSACDDPRLKATLYDFDANEMLQSITFVWERPAWAGAGADLPASVCRRYPGSIPAACPRRSHRVACKRTHRWAG